MGLKFRRQHPLHFYIADFYCHEQRLVVEIDGEMHEQEQLKEHDENSTAELEKYGIRVIRFTNKQVINSIEEVIQGIIQHVQNENGHKSGPSPQGEGESEIEVEDELEIKG